ncbi:glycosyltransferase [Microbacterium sp. ARD32]|uniref:glycosyltransferase n=1 Tax=Microbacterium sp. ARD32 TaxID=2962577 RepID=UPI00288192BB|nr:glycosyltransferase [Microbacterium sp. ARD32]MDT0156454.1 glycosyltransferase [Microbacterium sp. ARD32]
MGIEGFPDAAFLVLSSRLVPGLDGGYTIATAARARQLAEHGADVQVLTVDPADAAAHAAHRAEFARLGMLPAGIPLRNLFDEASAPEGGAAGWLRAASTPASTESTADSYRELTDAEGRPCLALPVIQGNPDWHLSTAPVRVYDEHGDVIGTLPGFGGLYRAWLDQLVEQSARPVVVICESRQLGELLAEWSNPGARIVHAIHTMHLEPPYTADAPLNALWSRWFAVSDRFDAVIWPTPAQRDDVQARFGGDAVNLVAPHGIRLPEASDADRETGLVVSVSRLAPGKRVDHLVRAFLAADVPGTRLEIWGDGPSSASVAELIGSLGAGERVRLMGRTDDPDAVLRRASLMVTATAYEGQGLSIVEALAAGCPVVSYDVRYGPGDALRRGGGLLVRSGDEGALADAIRRVLTDAPLQARLAAEAPAAASAWSEDAAMAALASATRTALASPPRR